MRNSTWAALAVLGALTWANPANAQQPPAAAANPAPGIRRIPLQRFDVPETAYETVIGMAEIAPSVLIGRHTHPGPESGYLLEGELELLIDGAAPRLLKAGESYQVPAGTTHDAKAGPNGTKVIATYVVLKGQPLASAAK